MIFKLTLDKFNEKLFNRHFRSVQFLSVQFRPQSCQTWIGWCQDYSPAKYRLIFTNIFSQATALAWTMLRILSNTKTCSILGLMRPRVQCQIRRMMKRWRNSDMIYRYSVQTTDIPTYLTGAIINWISSQIISVGILSVWTQSQFHWCIR